ncbi:hypothetical protein BDV06DRAFT_208520 [Aspergillus oleicola]
MVFGRIQTPNHDEIVTSRTAEATSEILISDLPTKEVTLAPGQASVVRDIHTTIQPGQNEITILGLSPHVNRESIRIEGFGAATITDIQTSVVPQRQAFDDAFPVESDESLSDSDEDISEDEDGLNDPELQGIQEEIDDVSNKLAKARSEINTSLAIIDILDQYGKGLQKDENKDVKKLEEFLALYSARRDVEGHRNNKATLEVTAGEKELAKLKKKLSKRKAQYAKEQRAASKAIWLRNERRARARDQKRKEQRQKRVEQRHFWPSTIGKVVVSLDSQSHSTALTPTSSRRSSITEKVIDADDKTGIIDVTLRLSYIIPGPGWASRYELAINSPTSSAQMTYRAEFSNSSSEIWRDTRVTLSTSQASFSGIGERIPSLDTWNIKLVTAASKAPSWEKILDAPRPSLLGPTPSLFPPRGRFGSGASGFGANRPSGGSLFGGGAPQTQPAQSGSPFGNTVAQAQAQVAQQSGGLFGSVSSQPQQSQQSGSLFGQPPRQSADKAPDNQTTSASRTSLFGGGLFGALRNTSNQPQAQSQDQEPPAPSTSIELEDDTDADNQSLTSTAPSLSHQDTLKQEHGLTTTYNLPGLRTLPPSLISRRHVLATLDLNTVSLTYVIVPKHREAAFLRARVKNTSSLTLHPGTVGITVDGSFVGSASLEKCSPGVFFNISLGVDPGIEVKYAKPTVKPLSGGIFFNKEDGAKFRRSCWVKNTKAAAADLVFIDQVPVSDDEKLGVRVVNPTIQEEGDEVPIQMEKSKGFGTATLLKNGEVKWTLKLEAGQEVKLVLEYEARVPSGSDVVSV